MTRGETQTSTSARILYRPLGIATSIVAGVVAGQVFKQAWKHSPAGTGDDAPKALESEYSMREVILAATIQGAIFAGVKALADRGGARLFERWTGEWPGD